MALDFGGLDYTISVRDQFSSNVDAFRAGITGARSDFRKLKTELAAPVRSGGQRDLARATRATAQAVRDETKAVRASRRERRDAVRVLSLSRAAKISLGKETRRLAVAQAKANLEVRRNLVNSRQQLAADQIRVRAERDLAKVIDARGRSEAVLAAAKARGVTLSTQELRQLKLLTIEQEKLFLAKKKLQEQESIAGNKELRRITAETAAIKLQNAELQKAANLKAIQARQPIGGGGRIPQAQFVTGATPAAVPTAPATFRDRIRNFLQLSDAQSKAAASANRFSFTFRRLIGILAAFTVVRLIVRGFTDLVRQLVLFNANIEQSTLGIASLFTAVGDVRDATGEAASASQALAIAQKEARRQTQLLRRDALQTAATFDVLLQTFQVAVAPGLAAGLDIDEIRDFTVRISQAASAIGLQQNQLAEEIRSILSGTIQARTTRIAVALGITNEDIRLAKEAGVLTQFLNERFEAFKQSGIEALGTFNALLTNTRDAILLLFEEGGLEFFEELKSLLADIQGAIRSTDVEGTLVPSSSAVAIIRAIADGLRTAVAQVRALVSEEGIGGLEGLAIIIGQTIGLVATVLAPIVAGILAGLNDIKNGFLLLKDTIAALGIDDIFSSGIVGEVVKQIVRMVTIMGVLTVSTLALAGAWALVKALIATSLALLFTTKGLTFALVAAIAIGVESLRKFAEEILGVQVSLTSLVVIMTRAFINGFKFLIARIATFMRETFSTIALGINVIVTEIIVFLLQGIKRVLGVLARVSDLAQDAFDAINETQKTLNLSLERQVQIAKDVSKERAKELAILERMLDAEVAQVADDEAAKNLKNAFDLREVLNEIPGIISRQRQPLEAQGKLIKELTDDAQKAADALRFSGETFGLEGGVLEQRKIQFEALIALREKGLILTNQEKESQQELGSIEEARVKNERALKAFDESSAILAQESVVNAEELLRARNALAKAETQVALERLRLKSATKDEAALAIKRFLTAKETEAALKDQVAVGQILRDQISFVLAQNLKTKDEQEAIAKIITNRVRLNGREVVANERLRAIAEERVRLARFLNTAANDRIALVARQAVAQARIDAVTNRVELENRRRELAARGTSNLNQELIAIQGEIDLAEALIAVEEKKQLIRQEENEDLIFKIGLQERNFIVANQDLTTQEKIAKVTKEQVAAQSTLATAKESGNQKDIEAAEEQLADITALLKVLETIQALELQLDVTNAADVERLKAMNLTMDELIKKLLEAKDLQINPFPVQAQNAMEAALVRLGNFGTEVVQKFSDFAANAIVDAFDPTKDVNLKERFASFLQDIARQILALTIQIAILRAFSGTGGATALTGATGGPIPRFAAKGGHERLWKTAQGFDGGGVPNKPAPASMRPSGLPSTDKVPVWTSRGEWIIRQSSAAKYGNAVMSAINQGMLDPTALRSLAGIGGRHTVRSSRGPGFQEGGLISDAVQAQRAADEQAGGDEAGIQILPTLLADRQTMRRLIDGGAEELLDFMRENNTVISSADQSPG